MTEQGRVLRAADMTADELQEQARHLRTLAGLDRPGAQYADAWRRWGLAEVVSTDGAPARALQVGELVLIAPLTVGAQSAMVHSKVRADDILVPQRCVHILVAPDGGVAP